MAVTPFRIAVPDSDLDVLHAGIGRTRWPDQVEDAGWDYGTPLGFLQELVEYWANGFRWREREQLLNVLPQYRTTVDAPTISPRSLRNADTVSETVSWVPPLC